MNKLLFSLFLIFSVQLSWAQGKAELHQHFDQLAKGKKSKVDQKTLRAFRQNAGVVAELDTYLKSDQVNFQKEALWLSVEIGTKHEYAISRIQMVNQLLKAAQVVESAQLGRIVQGLQRFKRDDFDNEAKAQLARLIQMERSHVSKFIELAGFLQMHEFLDGLRSKYKDNKHLYQSVSIALTRCGDRHKRNNLMKNVVKYRVNDEFVYGIMPMLVYARQKETTNYLFDIILRDQKTCSNPGHHGHGKNNEDDHDHPHPHGQDSDHKHEHDKSNCAYRVMEAIAPYVKDIPLQLSASGDLVTTDYNKTLETTREWILANRNSYELNTNIY
ncbi:MAG: hypothetical protein AAF985_12910 [Bacteroidota bacterium]